MELVPNINMPEITLFGCLSGIVVFISSMALTSNIKPFQRYLETDISVFQHRTAACVVWTLLIIGIFATISAAFDNGIAAGLLQSICIGLGFAMRDVLSNVFAWFYLWYEPWAIKDNKITLIHSALGGPVHGTLNNINTFTTTLKENNSQLVIPNRYFLTGMVRHSYSIYTRQITNNNNTQDGKNSTSNTTMVF